MGIGSRGASCEPNQLINGYSYFFGNTYGGFVRR